MPARFVPAGRLPLTSAAGLAKRGVGVGAVAFFVGKAQRHAKVRIALFQRRVLGEFPTTVHAVRNASTTEETSGAAGGFRGRGHDDDGIFINGHHRRGGGGQRCRRRKESVGKDHQEEEDCLDREFHHHCCA
jgi:hypothetical protein